MFFKKRNKRSHDLVLAIDWAAAEYAYLMRLKEELKLVEQETDINDELKHLKKATRILKYLTRAEKRAYQYEEKIDGNLVELLPELEKLNISPALILGFRDLISELKIEHDQLAKFASWYDSILEGDMDKLRAEAVLEKKMMEYSPEKASQLHQSFLELLHQLQLQVADTETWIRGLEITLKKAKALLEKLPSEYREDIYREGMSILKEWKFPIEKYPSEAQMMARHPDDLKSLYGKVRSGNLLAESFQWIARFGKLNEENWWWIVEIAKVLGDDISLIVRATIPTLTKNGIIRENNFLVRMDELADICREFKDGEEALELFTRTMASLVESHTLTKEKWPRLLEIIKLTKKSDELFFNCVVIPFLKKNTTAQLNEKEKEFIIAVSKFSSKSLHYLQLDAFNGFIDNRDYKGLEKAIKEHSYDKRYYNIQGLSQMGFLSCHVTNAFAGPSTFLMKAAPDKAFANIIYCLENQGTNKSQLSFSTIRKDINSKIVISKIYSINGSIGVVLDSGYIYEAYKGGSITGYNYKKMKTGLEGARVTPHLSVTTETSGTYNELLTKKWTVGGLFYTKGVQQEIIDKLKAISVQWSNKEVINPTWINRKDNSLEAIKKQMREEFPYCFGNIVGDGKTIIKKYPIYEIDLDTITWKIVFGI